MRSPSHCSALRGLASGFALLASDVARADWPTDPGVNLKVCNASGDQLKPSMAADMAGGVYIVWYDQRNGRDSNIWMQRVLASGVVAPDWPVNGLVVCSAPGDQVLPQIVSDGAGGAVLTWQDRRDGVSADIYAHRVRPNATFSPGWPAQGRAVCTTPGEQTSPAIVSDNAGGALLLWQDTQNDTDLYAGHVLASGALDTAWPSGGAAFAVSDFGGLKRAADQIANELKTQYRLGYDPPVGPSRFRKVQVKTTRKGVVVRTRSGYVPS